MAFGLDAQGDSAWVAVLGRTKRLDFLTLGSRRKNAGWLSLSFDENIESALFGLTTFYRCLKNSTDVRIVGLLAMKSATIFIPNADHLLPFFPWL